MLGSLVAFVALSVASGCTGARECDVQPRRGFWLDAMTGEPIPPSTADLSVVTFNIHSGFGRRRALWRSRTTVQKHLSAIASAIARRGDVDVVGLTEVDFASRRTGNFDQAAFIASDLERITGDRYRVVRAPAWSRATVGFETLFGNALVTRLPVLSTEFCTFDDPASCLRDDGDDPPAMPSADFFETWLREPRVLVSVDLAVGSHRVRVALTHLDAFSLSDREYQAEILARRYRTIDQPTVLMGDMNAVPVSMAHERVVHRCDRTHRRLLGTGLMDAALPVAADLRVPSLARFASYPAQHPRWPLDWILVSSHLRPIELSTIPTSHSDHAGVFARLHLNTSAEQIAQTRTLYDSLRVAARSSRTLLR